MTVKSVISIDVDDENFKKFKELYDKFEAQVAQLPDAWAKVNEEHRKSMDANTAALNAMNEAATGAQGAAEDVESASSRTETLWRRIATSTGSAAKNILQATRSLLTWGTLTGVVAGLLGAGGLFGIERLAYGAADRRRGAQGLGMSIGERSAFSNNYDRLVDSSGFLSGVNEALRDVTKRSSLYGAGMGERDLRGKDTGQVSAELLQKLKRIADQTPDSVMAQVLQARGLDQFISLQDFQRLKATSPEELAGINKNYGQDRKTMALADKTARQWQDFNIQLNRAGLQIEAVFVRGLTPLVPALEKLSGAAARSIGTLLGNPKLQVWLEGFAHGIESLARYIGDDKFQKDLMRFGKGIGDFADDVISIAKGIRAALVKLGVLEDKSLTPVQKKTRDDARSNFFDKNGNIIWWDSSKHQKPLGETLMETLGDHLPTATKKLTRADTGAVEDKYKLPRGLLWGVYGAESHFGDPKFMKSKAGAEGPFQFMPKTAASYGLHNSYDSKASADAAGRYYRDLLKMFKGDVERAIAGYNWGEGNVQKAIAKWGADWKSHLPKETKGYLIKVENNSGNNAIVNASQLR